MLDNNRFLYAFFLISSESVVSTPMHNIDELPRDLDSSIFSFLAVLSILVINRLENTIVLSSFAASCYIMFHLSNTQPAKYRNLVGGHLIGLYSGLLAKQVHLLGLSEDIVVVALAVGLSSLVMSVIDVPHPPANGTALAVALNSGDRVFMISVISSICIILLVNLMFRRYQALQNR